MNINVKDKMMNEKEELDDLILIKLHENKSYLNDCVRLLNSWWPRSETAR